MAKDNFLLKDEWGSLFASLPDAKAGQLIKAVFSYHSGEEFDIDDPVLSAVFEMIRSKIDENERKYEDRCKKNAESGRKGGLAKKADASESKQTLANATDRQAKQADNDSDNDSDNDIDYVSDNRVPKGTTITHNRKHKYGEYSHVLLSDDEYSKLTTEYGPGDTNDAVKYLDEYIEMKGAKYKSHYLAIRKWVIRAVREKRGGGLPYSGLDW